MFKNLKANAFLYAERVMQWVDPQWWIWLSLCIFILCMIHLLPLKLKEDNHNFSDRLFLWMRVSLILGLITLLLFPLVFYLAFGILTQASHRAEASHIVVAWYMEMLRNYWGLPVAAWLLGLTANFSWHRFGGPYLSNLRRKYRVTQHEDVPSDIRNELAAYETKSFNPEKYFKEGYYFVALDEKDQPIYIDAKDFEETHSGTFAPTGFGKGVSHGVILTQAALRGNTVFWIDPKGDKRAPYILQAAAKKAGKPFIYLDLNPSGKGNWHPFKGGALRDRRARILAAFGLGRTGTNADVYKTKERSFVDSLLNTTDGSIPAMLDAAKSLIKTDDLSELRDGLAEWAQISTFTPNRKRKGHSIEQCLLNNAVVYVKGALNDSVVKAATRAYVSELIQEANRLYGQRTSHITAFVDEVRFLISNEIVDALATTREMRMNMLIATQAITDLLALEDKTINGEALKTSVEVNCQIKMIYRAGDNKTAEWGEELAGTKTIRVAMNERTEVNRWGAEEWGDSRSFRTEEVPLYHRNVFLSLPQMVFVLYRPKALATVGFSSWLNVDQSVCSWEKKESDGSDESPDSTAGSDGKDADVNPQETDSAKAAALVVSDPSALAPAPAPAKVVSAKPVQVQKQPQGAGKPAASSAAGPQKKARGNPKLAGVIAAASSQAGQLVTVTPTGCQAAETADTPAREPIPAAAEGDAALASGSAVQVESAVGPNSAAQEPTQQPSI